MDEIFRIARDSSPPKPSWLSKSPDPPQNIHAITNKAIQVYFLSSRPNGSINGIGWWQCANGYTAIALHNLWSPNPTSYSSQNFCTVDTAIRKCEARQRGLINVFNDDTLWWGMLCLHMYALCGDSWYLDVARGIWRHVKEKGVCERGQVVWRGEDMEGAVYWTNKPSREEINSISTSLFAELSVRLALIVKVQTGPDHPDFHTYISAARLSLDWILHHRYRPQHGVVLDHIKLRQDKRVDWTFTYNTGVVLGVCALLYQATGEENYLHLACHIATRAMAHSGWVEATSGVLTEKGPYGRGTHDPWKDSDAVGFKAVLIRQLGVVYDVIRKTGVEGERARETAEMIKVFVNLNFQAQVERNSNGEGQYGPWWDGPFECPTSHSQMAVLDVMAAVRLVNK